MDKNKLYREIPKVDVLLENKEIIALIDVHGQDVVVDVIRQVTDDLRKQISISDDEAAIKDAIAGIVDSVVRGVNDMFTPNMKHVINATGTMLHTNLGRALISKKHVERLSDIVSGYSNLEYNLEAGARGERYSHFERLLCKITGAEAAMAVNNNASAVMLVLSSLCKGGEVVVSRGELVEIGGKFRVPDVMEQSGAKLYEIGTTNKTHLSDYEEAVNEETKAILKVHTSNFRVIGFTESVPIEDLSPIAKSNNIPLIEDIGSGVLIDLSKYGLTYEPTVQDSIRAGADVVCFSGDKLLGGPQAGIIVGKKEYIQKMKKNQLTRALRIDKFTAACLELTLLEYLNEREAIKNIPILRMLCEDAGESEKRAKRLQEHLEKCDAKAKMEVIETQAQVGGGSMPLERLKSYALSLVPNNKSIVKLEEEMRRLATPIIPRIGDDRIILDMRCIEDDDIEMIGSLLGGILN